MSDFSSSLAKKLSSYLDKIDISNPEWKENVTKFVIAQLTSSRLPSRQSTDHIARFSIGEDSDSSDSVDVNGDANLCNEEQFVTATEQRKVRFVSRSTQSESLEDEVRPTPDRSKEELQKMWKDGEELRDGDALRLLKYGDAKLRDLESRLGNFERAIAVRRSFVAPKMLKDVPFKNYDYKYVVDSCCENVLGYIPIPLGVAGPLKVNGEQVWVPMATTEGALVASTNRGCSAVFKSGGVSARVSKNGMSRAPVVKFPSMVQAVDFKFWLQKPENFKTVKLKFEESSKFARLTELDPAVEGNFVFIRFVATTGDAMGMNMVSKGCSLAMKFLQEEFPEMSLVALSGNYCTDKKAAAVNWIKGRGKSVEAECRLPAAIVRSVLKTTPQAMVEAAKIKLQLGSARACAIGGQNAHSANIVAALFLATGQDAAQVVSSSMCATNMELTTEGDLYVTVSMQCLEVGTVGGGTILPPQNNCLQMQGCAGSSVDMPGRNACRLAEIIAATVLAGELSLMAALVKDELVSSHMKLNRSRLNLYPNRNAAAGPPDVKNGEIQRRTKKNSERGSTTLKVDSNIL